VRFATTVVCACVFSVAACTGDPSSAVDGRAIVTGVVDGDTIDVEVGGRSERVRMIGIDTPETKKPNSPVECYGPEASAFTTALLPQGTAVRLERDVVGRDDYGRLLAYVYLANAEGHATTHVNMTIVEHGFARPLTIDPNSTFARDFARAAGRAERDEVGLWAACSP
jgi:micrococcal nuclease